MPHFSPILGEVGFLMLRQHLLRMLRNRRRNQGDSFALNGRIVPESFEPNNIRLAPEPCHLAFRIIAVPLLRRTNSFFPGEFAAQQFNRLSVPERRKRASARAVAMDQLLGLLEQTRFEHLTGTLVDAFIKFTTVRDRGPHAECEIRAADRVPAATALTTSVVMPGKLQ